jgi:hypothetical protein
MGEWAWLKAPVTLIDPQGTRRLMSSADAEVYAALAQVLSRLGVRWYVFGAQAAILYAAARFTEDIEPRR